MEPLPNSTSQDLSEHHIVRADEIDSTGTDISAAPADEGLVPNLGNEPPSNVQNDDGIIFPKRHVQPPIRPELRRDRVAPPPPLQPPPPAPPVQQNGEFESNSLSLAELRKIVQDMPKTDQPAYAFSYADCQPFPEELDEWFAYRDSDRVMLIESKDTFERAWSSFCEHSATDNIDPETSWTDASDPLRISYIEKQISYFDSADIITRVEAFESICYLVTGVWGDTAGIVAKNYPPDSSEEQEAETPKEKSSQIQWMVSNSKLFERSGGIPALFKCLLRAADRDQEIESRPTQYIAARDREINLILTCFYLIVETGRRQLSMKPPEPELRNAIASLSPNLPAALVGIVARLRWDDPSILPLTRILLLLWKSVLLIFGGLDSLARAKSVLEPNLEENTENGHDSSNIPTLTASPLDYHLFRQEITSKYPAYNPPPPLIPFELDQNSILPPRHRYFNRTASTTIFGTTDLPLASHNDSILHQSVHIATPAPSPPPSPGATGKAGKKQNYQTNQHFPFMYPPLDSSSNNLGGKGSTDLQDSLVGRKWEGSDVPASIIEAGTLFSSRMKMTRAIQQLWEERERFLKYDRGWDDDDDDGNDADEFTSDHEDEDTKENASEIRGTGIPPSQSTNETEDNDIRQRLNEVEKFYTQALPNLQSFVIVVLKEVLTAITTIASKPKSQNDNDESKPELNGQRGSPNSGSDPSPDEKFEEFDESRSREIMFKAVSGSLILLLKWFKRSHILKFEYLAQLLLDSNYIPLILKMFIHQEVDRAIAQKNDREDLSFFRFCHMFSHQPPDTSLSPPESEESTSEDEAAPPPILRHRRSPLPAPEPSTNGRTSPTKTGTLQQGGATEGSRVYEADELGYPTAPIEDGPITDYSFRNFFTAINFLHVMQKITRGKAHRCLLLMQYKCSTVLRKGLKIPDPHLRLYTLKLFKSQVPYCGRKWRLSHMRVITAIYLYCRPELRDDWLAGGDVDAEVGESLPMEQALRGLTHWWHLRQYKDVMAGDHGKPLVQDERDFFTRELEKIGWGWFGDELAEENGDIGGGNMGHDYENSAQPEGW
ncbi:Factor arrest protein 11 [Myotisia sp. PD_48]|nr:Factor arrest protein 11 [Myotisia sp. PD_48]